MGKLTKLKQRARLLQAHHPFTLRPRLLQAHHPFTLRPTAPLHTSASVSTARKKHVKAGSNNTEKECHERRRHQGCPSWCRFCRNRSARRQRCRRCSLGRHYQGTECQGPQRPYPAQQTLVVSFGENSEKRGRERQICICK